MNRLAEDASLIAGIAIWKVHSLASGGVLPAPASDARSRWVESPR
jgi:hypothetical protein